MNCPLCGRELKRCLPDGHKKVRSNYTISFQCKVVYYCEGSHCVIRYNADKDRVILAVNVNIHNRDNDFEIILPLSYI